MTNLAAQISPHLPLLRRFARALTGSQDSGDAYVSATLSAIVEDRETLSTQMPVRAALYAVFLQIWSSLEINLEPEQTSATTPDMRLRRMTPKSRQAFLLIGMEGFDRSTAARIMGVSGLEFDNLITLAGQDLAEQMTTRVMIIEDEPLIAMDIEDIVRSMNHEITGVARTHSEAIALVEKEKPGLILADIQLADGSSGIDAVNELLSKITVPVVFITAFPERLLTGERPEPAFLLSKPFQPVNLRAVITQVLFFNQSAQPPA